jgi:hypothetical protein
MTETTEKAGNSRPFRCGDVDAAVHGRALFIFPSDEKALLLG